MLEREMNVVLEAVHHAGELLRQEASRPDGPRGAGTKADIDTEIEAFLAETIGQAFPEDHLICEEGHDKQGTSSRAFHIDPHDGTRDFLKGRRETSISIALVERGKHLLGVVYAPIDVPLAGGGELLVSWAQSQPLLHNGQPVPHTITSDSAQRLYEQSLVLISTRVQGEAWTENQKAFFPARLEYCASIATRLSLVAIGVAEAALTLNHYLSSWDFAAGQALLQAAGGDLFAPTAQIIEWDETSALLPAQKGYIGTRNTPLATNIAQRVQPLLKS